MDNQLTLFIALTAVAILLQAGVLLAIYLSVARVERDTRSVRKQLDERMNPILNNIQEITENARDLSLDARRQMDKFDKLSEELSDRLHMQVVRLDYLLGEALDKVEEAGSNVRERVAAPMREATAVMQGVKAALASLNLRRSRRRRPQSEEELFI